ncbi:hypothetical protein [Microbacterium indicum]|uniref:hypothetical protein n=1 Tax=Microbacterium indicum TaxID=358100 RepID=UPI00041926F0|nr:hypothetical protein [Microbacterium indicum]
MRRRRTDEPPRTGLDVGDLRPAPLDDLARDYDERKRLHEDWVTERTAWVERRRAHDEAHGWPGGTIARITEEDTAHPIPDMPFDPDIELARGNL